MWQAQFGGETEKKLEALQDEGHRVPALENKPQPSAVANEVVVAFSYLHSARTGSGFGPNPISLAEIASYLDLMGEPFLPRDVFIELLLITDRKYMTVEAERLKRERESRGRKN